MALRIGVIGLRFGSIVHIPAYQAEGLDVVAVCSTREETAKAAAEKFGVPNWFTNHREMLAMEGLDAVAVVTPRPLHYSVAKDSLAAGKHIICEKPFTTELDQARELWETAEKAGVTAMVAHEFRFATARARVKELIDEGYIGNLHMCMVQLANPGYFPRIGRDLASDDQAERGGGLLWGQGSHYVDCLRHWFGEVQTVSGQVFTHLPDRKHPETGAIVAATADDAYSFTLGFANGGWASMVASYVSPHGQGTTIEIYGSDGSLSTPQPDASSPNPPPHGKLYGAKLGEPAQAELAIPERLNPYSDDLLVQDTHDGFMPMRMLAREFVNGVESGTSPSPSFYDAYRCQQVLHAVRESSTTGRIVEIAAAT